MTDHHIQAKLAWAHEYYRKGPDGYISKNHPTTRFATAECTLTGDNLDLATLLSVSIPKDQLPGERVDGEFGWLTRLALPKYLASRRINAFAEQKFDLSDYLSDDVPPMPDEYKYSEPVEIILSSEDFEYLQSQMPAYTAARESFDAAVSKLKEYAGMWPEELKSRSYEVFDLLQFLDDCLAAGHLRFMYTWYGEKQAMIRREFSHMIRLKNSYHPGYQQRRDNISGMLFSYGPPHCWTKRPPEPVIR